MLNRLKKLNRTSEHHTVPSDPLTIHEIVRTRKSIEKQNAVSKNRPARGFNAYTAQELNNGYYCDPMSPTDELYSDEDHSGFYDENGGFCERNNYLDRI